MKLISLEEYKKIRVQNREKIISLKATRSICVGPDARFMFECYETIWTQIQEMLYVERGGKDQEIEEIEAYNPLIPKGSELIATLFFEIESQKRRLEKLSLWGGIEKTAFLSIGDDKIYAQNADDLERTNASGKTSAVHFLKFSLNNDQKKSFSDQKLVIGFNFEHYNHMSVIPEIMRNALLQDFT